MASAQLLIVDDDRLILHTLSTGLRSAGYRTVEAESGESAIKIARELPIDLAIIDVRMTGMSGLELAEYLRMHTATPCIFLSAYADTGIVEQAVAEGALGYLVKPLDVPNIIPSIEAALVRAKELSDLKETQAQLSVAVNQARSDGMACLASVIDSAMDAIITVDKTCRILVFNRAAEAMFRCKAADAIGQHLDRFIPERFRAGHHVHMREFGATGATTRAMGKPGTVIGLRADGGEFPVEATIARAGLSGRKQFTVMLRDISERMRAEEMRSQLEAQLREAQKMDAIGTLAGGIAHDFNNILGAIIGNTALARQEVGAGHPSLVSLDEIHKASQRAKDLVHRILTFSRKQPQQTRLIALRSVVEDAVKLLRATLPAGVDLATACAEPAPYVLADATQIEQVLLNLCTNAWHAMEGRAGRIEIGLDEILLDDAAVRSLPGLQSGRHARLRVSDNGKGMDAATQARIFEPFFTTKPVDQGTGLGLSVVHGIIKAHHGAIAVHSAPGVGATFQLYFPAVAASHAEALPEPAAPDLARGSGQHVLYVDDDEAMVLLVTRMLEELGYRVSGYGCTEAALAAVRAHPGDFDLAVTDFNMPGQSGLEVAQELARIRHDLPVVITSGYITEELRANALQAGVRHLVYKPNTIDELCEIIQRLLGTAGA